jgi:pyruvate dehydrogenase E2 component (dihydrolipoamide acetyltransferase)
MATEFQMPKLGLTMESGTILDWLVPDGATVAHGQAVLLIETDKVESEIESRNDGVLHQTGEIGELYECGARIGWFLAEGEDAPAETASASGGAPAQVAAAPAPAAGPAPVAVAQPSSVRGEGGRILASPNAKRIAASVGVDLAYVTGSGPGGRIVSEDVEEAARHPRPAVGGRILASPNAKRVAASLGVDLAQVAGTGPGGRIVSEDVEEAARRPRPGPAPAPGAAAGIAPVGPTSGGTSRALATFGARNLADMLGVDLDSVASLTGDPRLTKDDVVAHVRAALAGDRPGPGSGAEVAPAAPSHPLLQTPSAVVPLRGMRGTIASRMHESLRSMAQLTLMMDVNMSAVVADRERRKADGAAPGFTDYVIAATAKALTDHPYVNSQVTDEGVAHLPEVHVGLAVALDDGLMVPVVRDTPTLDLESLSSETSRLAGATRAGKLQLTDMEGGTFSVTALGMFDVDGFTPVINPPNTAILGVGRLRDEVAWDGDTPVKATVLTLSLTWDHRAFDGAPAAEFTRTVRRYLEECDLT